jgi:hypothetical protein
MDRPMQASDMTDTANATNTTNCAGADPSELAALLDELAAWEAASDEDMAAWEVAMARPGEGG